MLPGDNDGSDDDHYDDDDDRGHIGPRVETTHVRVGPGAAKPVAAKTGQERVAGENDDSDDDSDEEEAMAKIEEELVCEMREVREAPPTAPSGLLAAAEGREEGSQRLAPLPAFRPRGNQASSRAADKIRRGRGRGCGLDAVGTQGPRGAGWLPLRGCGRGAGGYSPP